MPIYQTIFSSHCPLFVSRHGKTIQTDEAIDKGVIETEYKRQRGNDKMSLLSIQNITIKYTIALWRSITINAKMTKNIKKIEIICIEYV